MKWLVVYRIPVSLAVACILLVFVYGQWQTNLNRLQEDQAEKVQFTALLLASQVNEVVTEKINELENLKRRIELTEGDFFRYWEEDASFLIEQESSFKFVEWIDSSGVIQLVEPREGNEQAIGLDITTLDYRNADWKKSLQDSVYNLTQWLQLVQGGEAFLVDVPVYLNGRFMGTITAGMDFTERFDDIFSIADQYYIRLRDEENKTFYMGNDSTGTYRFSDLSAGATIGIVDSNDSQWTLILTPNTSFEFSARKEGLRNLYCIGIVLALVLSLCIFMYLNTIRAKYSSRLANNKLRALIDSSPVGIFVLDEHDRVVDFWNEAIEKILGWKKEEVIGQVLPYLKGDLKEEYPDLLQLDGNEERVLSKEIRRRNKKGQMMDLRVNVGAIRVKGGKTRTLVLMEDITRIKSYEERIRRSLEEKEVLLMEIHHRVKNNLAIIIGLIELQKEDVTDRQMLCRFKQTQDRIFSIAEVHELLYRTENFTDVNLHEYIKNIVERLRTSFDSDNRHIQIHTDIENIRVNINQAIPLGLLLNELITNSFKHAFSDEAENFIRISLKQKETDIELNYSDSGIHFDAEKFKESESMGMTIIHTLMDQLGANHELLVSLGFNLNVSFQPNRKGAHSIL